MDFLLHLSRNVLNDKANESVESFFSSVRAHPRSRYRFIAIAAASCGSASNFLVLVVTSIVGYDGRPAIVIGCAYIPVCHLESLRFIPLINL